jgi:hypothetical protein
MIFPHILHCIVLASILFIDVYEAHGVNVLLLVLLPAGCAAWDFCNGL